MSKYREARCAFVVIKLRIDSKDYFLLRHDKDWNDLNLIGGHQEKRDNGKFKRTARREMLEELSALRGNAEVALEPNYGAHTLMGLCGRNPLNVNRYINLFSIWPSLTRTQSVLEKTISARSMNFLVDFESLKTAIKRKDVSAFLELLESKVAGGLEAIPYSLDRDLGGLLDWGVLSKTFQKQLTLFHGTAN